MPYAVVWRQETPENGQIRKLMSSPDAIEAEDADAAKKEGLQILNELPPEQKTGMKPLAIVEVTETMLMDINGCERVYLPMLDDEDEEAELEFVDISATDFWTSQPWWLR